MADELLVLAQNDLWPMFKRQMAPDFIEMKSLKIKLSMMVDKGLYDTLDKDPLLLQQVSNVGTNHYEKIVASMREALVDAEKKAKADQSDAHLTKLERQLAKQLETLGVEAVPRMEKEATAVVNRWRKVKSDQNLSTFTIGFSVAVNLTGIGMHVAAIATTPFTGGVGGVMGIVGLARSVSMLAGTIYAQSRDIDSLTAKLTRDVKDLTKDFQDNNKKAKGADLAKEAFNAVFFPANVVASVNTLERQLAVLGRKTRAVELDLHKLAKEIHGGIAACSKAGKELERIEKEVSANKDLTAPLKKASAALDDCEKSLGRTIDNVVKGGEDLKKRLDALQDLTALMKELSKMRGKPLKIIEGLLRFGTVLASMQLSGTIKEAAEFAVETTNGPEALAALQTGPLKDVL